MRLITSLTLFFLLSGCAVSKLPDNFSRAMMNQDDPAIIEVGAPSYLLLLDALILTYPEDKKLLLAGSRLYGSYAGGFVKDDNQAKNMADQAMEYARRALCKHKKKSCYMIDGSQDELQYELTNNFKSKDIEVVYSVAIAWLGWIQAHSDDWNAIAQISKVKYTLQWVAEINAAYDNGMAQVYLGALETLLPPSLGGKPELGRQHFETAIEVSEGHNLMAYVIYAEKYARLMFEQELHDQLLTTALAKNPKHEGLTLINRLAQQQAQVLLDESSDYFE